eukprot:1368254-Rhodomonas_salina.1
MDRAERDGGMRGEVERGLGGGGGGGGGEGERETTEGQTLQARTRETRKYVEAVYQEIFPKFLEASLKLAPGTPKSADVSRLSQLAETTKE